MANVIEMLDAEVQSALTETISRTIIAGGKKSEFKKAVAKNLFRSMGAATRSYKQSRIQEVDKLVDLLWEECIESIADTAGGTARNQKPESEGE